MTSSTEKSVRCLHLILGTGGEALDACAACRGPQDFVLFLDVGVMHLLEARMNSSASGAMSTGFATADLEARGLIEVARELGTRLVSDAEFARLVRDHDHCLSWK